MLDLVPFREGFFSPLYFFHSPGYKELLRVFFSIFAAYSYLWGLLMRQTLIETSLIFKIFEFASFRPDIHALINDDKP